MSWQNTISFKRNFIIWRVPRDKLPTNSRIFKMGTNINTTCWLRVPRQPLAREMYTLPCSSHILVFLKGMDCWIVLNKVNIP